MSLVAMAWYPLEESNQSDLTPSTYRDRAAERARWPQAADPELRRRLPGIRAGRSVGRGRLFFVGRTWESTFLRERVRSWPAAHRVLAVDRSQPSPDSFLWASSSGFAPVHLLYAVPLGGKYPRGCSFWIRWRRWSGAEDSTVHVDVSGLSLTKTHSHLSEGSFSAVLHLSIAP